MACSQTSCVPEDDFELFILLGPPPNCQHCRHVLPFLPGSCSFEDCIQGFIHARGVLSIKDTFNPISWWFLPVTFQQEWSLTNLHILLCYIQNGIVMSGKMM